MDKASDAHAFMSAGRMNCSQAVLTAYCDQFGLERRLALKLAQGFGGGMGRMGVICGAVTGAYMVLGLAQKMSEDNPARVWTGPMNVCANSLRGSKHYMAQSYAKSLLAMI